LERARSCRILTLLLCEVCPEHVVILVWPMKVSLDRVDSGWLPGVQSRAREN
jgi:hypothetical protein